MPVERGEQHRALARLVGRWTGSSETFPSAWGPGGVASGAWSFRLDAAGFNLIHDYREQRRDGAIFEGHGVLTVDPASDEPVWFWFDSFGFPPLSPSRGVWEGDTLTLVKTTPRGEGRTFFRLDGDMLHHQSASRLTGQTEFSPVSEGRFQRES